MFDNVNMHLEDALHAPQVASNLVALRTLDANGLEYVVKAGMSSTFGGKLRFRVKETLYKLEGLPMTINMRREMDNYRNDSMCDQNGSVSDTTDESPGQANRAVVASACSPPKEVDWNTVHASVGHVSKELLAASATSMGVAMTRYLHSCEGCLATKRSEPQPLIR